MPTDVLANYDRSRKWAATTLEGAVDQLDAPTPCDAWDVRTLLNHMLDTQRYFLSRAKGEQATPPAPNPPKILTDDPVRDFARIHEEMLRTFGQPGVIDSTGPALGIAFADQLLHSWDLAVATGQDATMPDGLAQAAYDTIHGRFSDDQRDGMFKPEISVEPDASPQERLLAYTGRDPSQ